MTHSVYRHVTFAAGDFLVSRRQLSDQCSAETQLQQQKRHFVLPLYTHTYRPTPGPFYRATLCYRGICYGHVSVCLCLSQVGVLLKRLNRESHKQYHTIAQGLQFFAAKDLRDIRPGSPPTRAPNAGGVGQNRRLLTNNRLYLEKDKKIKDRRMVSVKVEQEVVCALSNGGIARDLEYPLTIPKQPIFCILHRHSQLRNG